MESFIFVLAFLIFTLWVGGLNDLIKHALNVRKNRKGWKGE